MNVIRPLLAVLCLMPLAASELKPGLVGEYYEGIADYPSKYPAGTKPFFVRVDDQVDFSSVDAQFYGTKLVDNFGARWTGILRVPVAGAWTLATESDDGSHVAIDGVELIDNGGRHGMQRVAATRELTAGDHALLVEFHEGEGGCGCRLLWTPPGGMEQTVPAEALLHEAGAEAAFAWDEVAWKGYRNRGPRARFSEMDHGPFVSGTIGAYGDNWAVKGLAITLDRQREALAVFDEDLLRWSVAGVDAFIRHPEGRDGLEGQPKFDGTVIVATRPTPGWAGPEGGFEDPRPGRVGPLPKEWARLRATYLHGQRVVMAYGVGAALVHDLPTFVVADGVEMFARSLAIDGATAPLTLVVCDRAGATGAIEDGLAVLAQGDECTAAALVGRTAGTLLEIVDGRVLATVQPSSAPFSVVTWSGPRAALPALRAALAGVKPEDPRALTKGGGGRRWPEALTTVGERGQGDAAYVCDTLTVPYDNPWKAYMRIAGHDFFRDGRAALCTIDGDVWIVDGIDDALTKLTWTRYATGLFQALGLKIVDDVVYVTCRDGINRLRDLDGDGEADVVEAFNHDCAVTVNYHEFHLELQTDAEGNFYYNQGSNLGQANTPHQGCVIKVSKDGSTLSVHATGLRAPNGMGGGDGRPLTTSDNQGNWMPTSRVNLIKAGGFYGMMDTHQRAERPATYDPPICWIPHGLDNSSGGQVWVSGDRFGPLKDALLHTSYGTSSLFTMFVQDVDGVPQGGVVRFPLTFQSGIMRARFRANDGQLYLSGMRGWQTNASREGAFHRVRFTGGKHYQPIASEIVSGGVRLRFAEPVDPELAVDLANYAIERWNYRYTGDYGSPEISVIDPTKEGRDPVALASAELDDSGTTLTLRLPDLAPVMSLHIRYKLLAADGAEMADDVYLTVNTVPVP